MIFDPSIFRAYDVRGIYGKTIDEGIMRRIGNAFGSVFGGANPPKTARVCVGWDVRTSSEKMAFAFVEGFADSGNDAIVIGQSPLAISCFAGWTNKTKTAYVTASHLGKEWNGIKFFDENGIGFLQKDSNKIKDIVSGDSYAKKAKGKIIYYKQDAIDQYIKHVVSKIRPEKRLKITLDSGNGAAGILAPRLFKEGGFDVKSIFEEPDGEFPNRLPDPDEDSLLELRKTAAEADISIAYDGDGDRMVVMDRCGRKLSPEQISYIILPELLKKETLTGTNLPGIVANVECTRMIDDIAKKFERAIYRVPVGHTYMMQAVHEKSGAFGVERSGHYSLPILVPFDDSIAISYYFACVISRHGKTLEEIVDEIPAYPFARLNFDCDDKKKLDVVERIKERVKSIKMEGVSPKINEMDGVRADFEDGWILIRASNTGPSIRLTIEANTPGALDRLRKEFSELLEAEIGKARE